MIENTLFYESIFRENTMNSEDIALFQQAENLANSGQTMAAYEIFRALRDRNPGQIEILFWIVETTPNIVESREVLDTIKHLQPYHPLISRTEAFHSQKLQTAYTPTGPVLSCPYCGKRVASLVKSKISIGGWVWFAAWFVVFICFLSVPVPTADMANMGRAGFFCLAVGIIGLFIIRKRTYACGHCGSKIADVH
jgi:DNA-directed RNA polymerase subunit RPC12/RpoP